jgi:hypothetical protein
VLFFISIVQGVWLKIDCNLIRTMRDATHRHLAFSSFRVEYVIWPPLRRMMEEMR